VESPRDNVCSGVIAPIAGESSADLVSFPILTALAIFLGCSFSDPKWRN